MSDSVAPKMLRSFDLDALNAEASTLVAIDAAGVMQWVNPAWYLFSTRNGARDIRRRFGLGTRYVEGIAGPLRDLYERRFAACLAGAAPVEYDYECSSPERFRAFRLRMLPLAGEGILLSHYLVAEHPHDRPRSPPDEARYRDGDGILTQCSNCRRARRADETAWDWIPEWVNAALPRVSHGLCPLCFGHLLGDDG